MADIKTIEKLKGEMNGEFTALYVATDTRNNRFATFHLKWNHLAEKGNDETKWTPLSNAQYETYKNRLHTISHSPYDGAKTSIPRQLPDNAHQLIQAAYEALSALSSNTRAVISLKQELSRPVSLEGADKALYQATQQVLNKLKDIHGQARREQQLQNEQYIKASPWLSEKGIEAIRREASAGEFELPGGMKGYTAESKIKNIEASLDRYKQTENLSVSRESTNLEIGSIQSLQRISKQSEGATESEAWRSDRATPLHIAQNQQGERFLTYNIPTQLTEGKWENRLSEAKWIPITQAEHTFYTGEYHLVGTIHQHFDQPKSNRQFQEQSEKEHIYRTVLSDNLKLKDAFDTTVKLYQSKGKNIEFGELKLIAGELKGNPAYHYQSGTPSEINRFNRQKNEIITLENRRLGSTDYTDRYMQERKNGHSHETARDRSLEYVKYHISIESESGKYHNRFITRNDLYTNISRDNLRQLAGQLHVVDRLHQLESKERWWHKTFMSQESRLDRNLERAQRIEKTFDNSLPSTAAVENTINGLIKDQQRAKSGLISSLERNTQGRLGERDQGLQRDREVALGTKLSQTATLRVAR